MDRQGRTRKCYSKIRSASLMRLDKMGVYHGGDEDGDQKISELKYKPIFPLQNPTTALITRLIFQVAELFHRGEHASILAMYGTRGFIDYDYVLGGYDTEAVLRVLRTRSFLSSVRMQTEPNSVLVCDNCNIHHSDELIDMVEAAGAKMQFLAAYSPIDNSIEMAFNVFKMFWKRERWYADNMALDVRIKYCIENFYAQPEKAAVAAYEKCGYY